MSQEIDCSPVVTPLLENSEEFVNTATHGTGLILSLVGTAYLMPSVIAHGDMRQILACLAFCLSMNAVYAASTLSHGVQEPNWKRVFRIWDQGLIYLMIAGGYTPLSVSFLGHSESFWMLTLVWMVAIGGFLSKIFFSHRIDGISIWLYVALGWIPAMSINSIIATAPAGALTLIVAGGVCYTVGVFFLIMDRREYHFHAIWHLLVIAGSACHFAAVLEYVAI
ncbi:hemolysin-III related [Lignipirellula cremea]|uniref:Hemolysin-III related n=2 Tax=Lignipirellula cremea TaxID=2528010 RepID=A0A518E336_9BACT|nr:hemolysin-III related [Lignipirellula cremea]